MTYNVFSGTLNPTQSINLSALSPPQLIKGLEEHRELLQWGPRQSPSLK